MDNMICRLELTPAEARLLAEILDDYESGQSILSHNRKVGDATRASAAQRAHEARAIWGRLDDTQAEPNNRAPLGTRDRQRLERGGRRAA